MEGTWDVYENHEKVGRCLVKKEGLYYHIDCRCRNAAGIYRLFWGEENLGILVPEGDELVLQTRQAAKRFPAEQPRFTLRQHQQTRPETFIPLSPTEPFAYLQELEHARFVRRGNNWGLLIFNEYLR